MVLRFPQLIRQGMLYCIGSLLWCSCVKTDLKNADLLNSVPGGKITLRMARLGADSFVLVNEPFPSFGLQFARRRIFNDRPDIGYFFRLRVSGTKNDTTFYIDGDGLMTPSQYDYYVANPNEPVVVDSIQASIAIMRGEDPWFWTVKAPGKVRGQMTLSSLGDKGDPVIVQFLFKTSDQEGYSDVHGTVYTRYVVYPYF